MLPRSKTLPHFFTFIFGAELRKMLKLKGRKLAPLESNIIYNNMRLEFSKITTRYIIRRLNENNYESRNQQAAALYDIIKTDIGVNMVLSYIMRFFQWCVSKSGALIQFHPTFCIKFNF